MDSIPSQLLLQVILILVNAFFAASEIAVLSLNVTQLEKQADKGEKTAQRLLRLTKEPSGFLSTIQIGITLAGFLGSAFAADNFSKYLTNWIYYDLGLTALSINVLDTISVIIITLILSYFTLVFGELVPKRIAMQKPYEVSKLSCGVVLGVAKIVKPIVSFLSLSTNAILKLLHLKTEANEESVTEEDILTMIELGEKRGILDEDESEWLQNIFDFDDTCIREIMTHSVDVMTLSIEANDDEIIQIIKETGLSRYPVYENDEDNIIGILHVRDYLLNLQTREKTLKELLTSPYFIPETISADDLFADMQDKNVHFAIAIDEFDKMSGIITLEDLVEEIFGNIYDEHDMHEQSLIQQINDCQWKVKGHILIDDLVEELGINISFNDDYDTLGGFLYSYLRTIPQDGTTKTLVVDEWSFQITKIQNKRIQEVIITKKESKSLR